MEDYKSNSFKSREKQEKKLPEKKSIKKVAVGKTKKKSGARKLADVFVSEDVENVKSYIVMDVLIPSIKKAISDIVTNGIDMMLYGESGRNRRSSTGSKISYGSYYNRDRDDRRRDSGYRGKTSVYDYDDILFDTRGDAEAVLDAMYDIIDTYGVVSVADFYELADVSSDNFAANKYGWSSLEGSRVMRMRNSYVLKFPKATAINQ